MHRLVAVLLVALAPAWALAQSETDVARGLSLRWELEHNFYQGKLQFQAALMITNGGRQALPDTGWALYFNASAMPHAGSTLSGLVVQDLGGCLFRFVPGPGFHGIAPGDSLKVEYVCDDWAANMSDTPEGFYLVWNNHREKGIPIGRFVRTPITDPALFDRFPGDPIPEATPQVVYDTNSAIVDAEPSPIFPTPVSYNRVEAGTGMVFQQGSAIVVDRPDFRSDAQYLQERLADRSGVPGMLVNHREGYTVRNQVGANIVLEPDSSLGPEGYALSVGQGTVVVKASTADGLFYGIQTLLQLGKANHQIHTMAFPPVQVVDAPRFGYRAVMADVARNFQTKWEIFRLIDLMAVFKLNVLHMHLTDDEGWRLEVPDLPELTLVGAHRGHTLDDVDFLRPCYGSGPDTDNVTGSGYYTSSDFIQILQYAQSRHIRVIPEIESPGHARAAIKAMDHRYRYYMANGQPGEALRYQLRDTLDASVYSTPQFYHDDVMNVGLPSTYRFIRKVVDAIVEDYAEAEVPLGTIHLGGDEVPKGVWEKSPACGNIDPASLWYRYFDSVAEILGEKGLYVSAWEEAGMRKTLLDGRPYVFPNPDFASKHFQLHIWNNGDGAEDLAYRMANAGYPVVLSLASNLYFDMAYVKAFDEFGYTWATYLDVDKPFLLIPFDAAKRGQRLTDYGKTHIIGLEGCLWGETVKGPKDFEYKLLPKLLGLAERAWAADPGWTRLSDSSEREAAYLQAWSQFVRTLSTTVLPFLDVFNGGYAYRIPTAGAIARDGKVWANVEFPGMIIRYTVNGVEPSEKSPLYTGPIGQRGTVRLRVFTTTGRGGRTVSVTNE